MSDALPELDQTVSEPKNRAAYQREWRKKNPEKVAAYSREWRRKNPEKAKALTQAWRKKNPEKDRVINRKWRKNNSKKAAASQRKSHLKYRFGVYPEHYEALLRSQKGRCAICGSQPQPKKALAVDHCHVTGNIRGLLCSNCNTGLGLLGDNVQSLKAAYEYVAGVTSWRLKIADEYLAKWSGT